MSIALFIKKAEHRARKNIDETELPKNEQKCGTRQKIKGTES